MGKYTDMPRRALDCYDTIDPAAVAALLPHLAQGARYDEPCAGGGVLMDQLTKFGIKCSFSSDIKPRDFGIHQINIFSTKNCSGDMFITNPPFNRKGFLIANDIAIHLSNIAPTWLLLPADYLHNAYKKTQDEMRGRLVKYVSIGRLYWMENKVKGKENFAWYLFDKPDLNRPTIAYSKGY